MGLSGLSALLDLKVSAASRSRRRQAFMGKSQPIAVGGFVVAASVVKQMQDVSRRGAGFFQRPSLTAMFAEQVPVSAVILGAEVVRQWRVHSRIPPRMTKPFELRGWIRLAVLVKSFFE